jgi:cobalt/nickel transport system permease protein
MAVIVTVAVFPIYPLVDLGIAVGLVAIAAVSGIPPFFLIKRIAMIEPIVLGVAVLALFQPGGGRIFGAMVVRSSLCVTTMVLLANTTPFPELLSVLRRLRIPGLLVTTIALMHRYLFVLGDEAMRMRRARASRSFARGHRHALKAVASVIGRLFVRAHDRSERIYAAMCARGWK